MLSSEKETDRLRGGGTGRFGDSEIESRSVSERDDSSPSSTAAGSADAEDGEVDKEDEEICADDCDTNVSSLLSATASESGAEAEAAAVTVSVGGASPGCSSFSSCGPPPSRFPGNVTG